MTTSIKKNNINDPCLSEDAPVGLSFESWIELMADPMSDQETALFLQGLQEHPEWMNQKNRCQETPLMIAAYRNRVDVVQALIQAGADLNFQNKWGKTALMEASYYGKLEVAKMLIQAGADLNVQDKEGCTALIRAAQNGQVEVVKALIKAKADLNVQNKEGWTGLMWAVHEGYVEVVQELTQQGADPGLLNHQHQKALGMAKKKGNEKIISLLEVYTDKHALSQVINSLENPSSVPARQWNEVKSQPLSKRPRL